MKRLTKVYINSSYPTVIFAAEELRKYLMMMRPESESISVEYGTGDDGFVLSTMTDLSLDTSDVSDTSLDDILYIDTDKTGGIIAGGNPRSVLLSVYEYLRHQGCRWLFPGIDGEYIPEVDELIPIKKRYKPTMRYRGPSSEGAISVRSILDLIDFLPKVGMNYYMIEFRVPTSYYKRYYEHLYNDTNRKPEPISPSVIKQWKKLCESEIKKRGLILDGVGHGWAMDAIGINSELRASDGDNEIRVPDESRKYLAKRDGERKLVGNTPNWTQFCMSNEDARRKFVNEVIRYAKLHTDMDYLHVSLGDARNNHCECEACRERLPSDWFVLLLNEIDSALTSEGMDTRIAFIAYLDTLYAPEKEVIKNPARFILEFCPVTRSYTESVPTEPMEVELTAYQRNKNIYPKTINENLLHFKKWRRTFTGLTSVFEYHMWRHQYLDVGNIRLAEIMHKDVRGYYSHGFMGIDENCSVRSFFPTGFLFYVYARTMFDISLTFDELKRDYFTSAFGEDGLKVADYLERLGKTIGFEYLEGQRSDAPEDNLFYAPTHVESIKSAKTIVTEGRELIKKNYNMPMRAQTYSYRLLELHADYVDMLSDTFIAKASGDDDEADVRYNRMIEEMGKREVYFESCYDHGLLFYTFSTVMNKRTKYSEPITY